MGSNQRLTAPSESLGAEPSAPRSQWTAGSRLSQHQDSVKGLTLSFERPCQILSAMVLIVSSAHLGWSSFPERKLVFFNAHSDPALLRLQTCMCGQPSCTQVMPRAQPCTRALGPSRVATSSHGLSCAAMLDESLSQALAPATSMLLTLHQTGRPLHDLLILRT